MPQQVPKSSGVISRGETFCDRRTVLCMSIGPLQFLQNSEEGDDKLRRHYAAPSAVAFRRRKSFIPVVPGSNREGCRGPLFRHVRASSHLCARSTILLRDVWPRSFC